ncbi:MAG: hypothetical protein ER33_15800 [Cyanobium sp. CACIAM 14]|nr:MAG: hypothetical protein ER33_15800 [Cyanobium sp. CACIAM 14]
MTLLEAFVPDLTPEELDFLIEALVPISDTSMRSVDGGAPGLTNPPAEPAAVAERSGSPQDRQRSGDIGSRENRRAAFDGAVGA